MSELQSHPHLTLAEHLAEIRAAARAIWGRHSQTLHRQSADAERWFDDGVTLHDAGKASAAFQTYIAAPTKYKGRRESKAHTPLSTVCTLRHARAVGWEWRRTLAVALIAAGHHSEFKTGEELDRAVSSMDAVIDQQIRTLDWAALDRAIGLAVPRPGGLDGLALCVEASDYLQDELLDALRQLPILEAVAYRLLCQLAFSVLLEADKAFLAVPTVDRSRYLAPRQAHLPPILVEEFLAKKPAETINPLRAAARRELFAGLDRVANKRVQTMTLPTGTGKTLLAASWALTLRERIRQEEGQLPLVPIVLPFLAIIDQTVNEYQKLFAGHFDAGEMITYHSLSDRTYDDDLEDQSQNFFLDTWRSDVVLTTFDQFLFALLSPKSRHQMRFHNLADAVIVLDEVQAMPCILWDPLRQALDGLTELGTTHVLAMSATQPGFLNKLGEGELIEKPGEFFAQMTRYRIVLRHRTPMKLSAFIDECKSRLAGWAKQRVLITLNTRRSARSVRDALVEELPSGMALEFLSADVTPRDRLAAIHRIKKCVVDKQPCLVVSTQCIEAGVDIDMDFAIRDFAPLDSLIQVAGRCNRNGGAERGTVEIVSLQADERNRFFADMVYTDKILLPVTREVLAGRDVVEEERVYPLAREYFAQLAAKKDTGEAITRAWVRWEGTDSAKKLLRGKQPPQVAFIVLESDPSLLADLEAASRVPDRWKRRDELKKLARRLAENTVNSYQRDDLDPTDYADPFPAHKTSEDVWFWLLRPGYYTAERGLVLRGGDEVDSWGMIL